jgi:hypothetical protein
VLAKDGQEAGLGFMIVQPALDVRREIVQALAASRDVKLMGELLHSELYSTVTLLARLRG